MIEESKLTKYYGKIANKLNEMIPCEWKRIVLYAEEIGNWSFNTFYFFIEDGVIHHWGNIPEEYKKDFRAVIVSKRELTQINKDLWLEFKNSEDETWYNFVFDINSDWKFSMKFGYERHDELAADDIEQRWAYDYLGRLPRGNFGKKRLKKFLVEQGRELPEELKDL